MSERSEAPLAVASTLHALADTLAPDDATMRALAETLVPEDAPGGAGPRVTERYRMMGILGAGGMGQVDHVWDDDLMRGLALKRLRPDLRRSPRLLSQFLWEARITAHLDHPGIVPLHELGMTNDGELYFTMKKVEGTSLEDALAGVVAGDPAWKERLTLSRRLRIFVSICDALAFAHERGVLHRDLKPANVMLGEHGEVLVMDWGLALPLPSEAGQRLERLRPDGFHESASSGTPIYMSPEQARGEPLDQRSDVYTLGAVLYEMVTLARPYEGATLSEGLAKVQNGEARPLAEVKSDLSPSLTAVITRAMSVAPADRYESVAELRRDVELVIEGRTPTAEAASIARRFGRFYASRNPALANLRVFHFELLMTSTLILGIAIGAPLAAAIGSLWWIGLPLSVALAVPPTLAWWRGAREAERRS